jgi:hypothetical protein
VYWLKGCSILLGATRQAAVKKPAALNPHGAVVKQDDLYRPHGIEKGSEEQNQKKPMR